MEPKQDNIKIFTYGTLQTGEALWPILKPRIGKPAMLKGYEIHNAGFPAICKSDNPESFVIGEIFIIDDVTLRMVDYAEGYHGPNRNNLYEREEVFIEGEGQCFCYTAEAWAKSYPLIGGGRW